MTNFDLNSSDGSDKWLTPQYQKDILLIDGTKIIYFRNKWYKTNTQGTCLVEELEVIRRKNRPNNLIINKKYYDVLENNTLSEEKLGCNGFCKDGLEYVCNSTEGCANIEEVKDNIIQLFQKQKEIRA